MRPEQIKHEINQLELAEKLSLVNDIWDSIAAENNEIPMAQWMQIELDKRYREYHEGKSTLHDWETVHKDLRKSFR